MSGWRSTDEKGSDTSRGPTPSAAVMPGLLSRAADIQPKRKAVRSPNSLRVDRSYPPPAFGKKARPPTRHTRAAPATVQAIPSTPQTLNHPARRPRACAPCRAGVRNTPTPMTSANTIIGSARHQHAEPRRRKTTVIDVVPDRSRSDRSEGTALLPNFSRSKTLRPERSEGPALPSFHISRRWFAAIVKQRDERSRRTQPCALIHIPR
jgi:hypothetical protein